MLLEGLPRLWCESLFSIVWSGYPSSRSWFPSTPSSPRLHAITSRYSVSCIDRLAHPQYAYDRRQSHRSDPMTFSASWFHRKDDQFGLTFVSFPHLPVYRGTNTEDELTDLIIAVHHFSSLIPNFNPSLSAHQTLTTLNRRTTSVTEIRGLSIRDLNHFDDPGWWSCFSDSIPAGRFGAL